MLSATPHDGRARSFASLMGMLDPTAIADPDNYTKDDLEGKHLFVRRFKKDIQHEAKSAFQERKTSIQRALATELEEAVFAALVDKANRQLTVRERTGWLFQTVLEKAVLSSPAACLETVRNRIKRLEKQGKGPKFTGPLQRISQLLTQVRPNSHSKYQCLLKMLRAWNWTGKDTRDRVVVFTERIATLNFLQENLVRDLGLNDGAVRVLKGTLSDSEQQEIVEAFGSTQTPIRLLLSTDVGSEGINLHYHCCKLIHFDIPWSLMVLQQRNGRIDRYGQERQPQIVYLLTESETAKFKDDQRILEILIDKEWQAHKNIGDPASLMGLYDTEAEVRKVGETIERDMSAGRAESNLFGHQGNTTKPFDPVAALLGATPLNVDQSEHKTRAMPSLYASDYAYLKAALMTIKSDRVTGRSLDFDLQYWDREQRLQFTAPVAMTGVIETLPVEARPKQRLFDLSGRAMDMMQEIKSCRSTESTWPQKHYLWPLHPMMDWTTDKVRLFFRRREAPIIALRDMGARQVGYVISASYSNRKGHTVYQKWYLIQAKDGECVDVVPFDDSREFRSLRSRNLTNAGCDDRVIEAASRFLPEAIDWASVFVDEKREEFVAKVEPKLDEHLRRLLQLEVHHEAHVEAKYTATDPLTAGRKAIELRRVRSKFDEYQTWIRDTMHIEETPFIQVVAVLVSH